MEQTPLQLDKQNHLLLINSSVGEFDGVCVDAYCLFTGDGHVAVAR